MKYFSKIENTEKGLSVIIPEEIAKLLMLNPNDEVKLVYNRKNRQIILSKVGFYLSPSHNLVLKAIEMSIENFGGVTYTGEIYRTYEVLAKKKGEKPLTKRRVSGIIRELEEEGIITTKLVSFGKGGRTKLVKKRVKL